MKRLLFCMQFNNTNFEMREEKYKFLSFNGKPGIFYIIFPAYCSSGRYFLDSQPFYVQAIYILQLINNSDN